MAEDPAWWKALSPGGARASRVGVAAASALVLLAASASRAPLLVWNASASSPPGLYGLVPGSPAVGDFVVGWPPADAAGIAETRGYLPRAVPLVKTMAGGPGDRVCARGRRVWINGKLAAVRRPVDRAGRPLPWWSGCRTLGPGEAMLLGTGSRRSFDGRYFGPTPPGQVVHRARLLWPA